MAFRTSRNVKSGWCSGSRMGSGHTKRLKIAYIFCSHVSYLFSENSARQTVTRIAPLEGSVLQVFTRERGVVINAYKDLFRHKSKLYVIVWLNSKNIIGDSGKRAILVGTELRKKLKKILTLCFLYIPSINRKFCARKVWMPLGRISIMILSSSQRNWFMASILSLYKSEVWVSPGYWCARMRDRLQLLRRTKIKGSIITDYVWRGNDFEGERKKKIRFDFVILK